MFGFWIWWWAWITSLDDKESESIGKSIESFTNDIAPLMRLLGFGMLAIGVSVGFYVWNHGFMGVHITGFYRVLFGIALFPTMVFVGLIFFSRLINYVLRSF